jgi:hypothetical protein
MIWLSFPFLHLPNRVASCHWVEEPKEWKMRVEVWLPKENF